MKFKNLLLFFFLTLLLGCSRDAMQDEIIISDQATMTDGTFNPHLKGEAVERPLKFFNVSGTFEYTASDECGEGSMLFTIMGSGQASHLGRHITGSSYCVVPPQGHPAPGVVPEVMIKSASGDRIYAHLKDIATPIGNGYFAFPYEIYKGTGRFKGAIGEYVLNVKPTFQTATTGIWVAYGEGYIVY